MKRSHSFTLLEVLIALSLSCVVVVGMLQAYRNLMKYLDTVHDILNSNRQVCLLFNQMERDFNTAFIPPLYKEEQPKEGASEKPEDKDNKEKKEDQKSAEPEKKLTKEEQEKEKQKELEKLKDFFLATADDDNKVKISGRMMNPFKKVTIINTNPLEVYQQRRIRLVRVMYELEKDKDKSTATGICYKLWRKETTDIENVKMKEDDVAGLTEKSKANPIRTHLVANNIKEFFIEYIFNPEKEQKDGEKKETGEPEEKRLFSWGDKKETMGVVPKYVEVLVSFWNNDCTQSHTYQAIFPVFSYPTMKDDDKKNKDKNGEESADTSQDKKGEKAPDNPPKQEQQTAPQPT